MFESDSRYVSLGTAEVELADGRVVRYARRRLVPAYETHQILARVRPQTGERLDLFTARTLGHPEHFWRVCDANGHLDPFAALDPSVPVQVPMPR